MLKQRPLYFDRKEAYFAWAKSSNLDGLSAEAVEYRWLKEWKAWLRLECDTSDTMNFQRMIERLFEAEWRREGDWIIDGVSEILTHHAIQLDGSNFQADATWYEVTSPSTRTFLRNMVSISQTPRR